MLTRSFSRLGRLHKRLDKDEITKAFALLSGDTTATEAEKTKYINYFTRALNSEIKKEEPQRVKSHFTQSLLGLNTLLNNNNQLDPISVKDSLAGCKGQQQVLRIFDELVATGSLNLRSLKVILMNKHVRDLRYIYERLDFMKRADWNLLVCSRAVMLKDFQWAQEIYQENKDTWISLRDSGSLTPFLEKSFYQLIWKVTKDLELIRGLAYSQSSYVMLIEALPRQMHTLQIRFPLTTNQQLFVSFVEFLVDQPVTTTSNKLLQQLMRLNAETKIATEKNNDMTIHKYRYVNGLLELSEDLSKHYGDVSHLVKQVHELDDVMLNETVLKFI